MSDTYTANIEPGEFAAMLVVLGDTPRHIIVSVSAENNVKIFSRVYDDEGEFMVEVDRATVDLTPTWAEENAIRGMAARVESDRASSSALFQIGDPVRRRPKYDNGDGGAEVEPADEGVVIAVFPAGGESSHSYYHVRTDDGRVAEVREDRLTAGRA